MDALQYTQAHEQFREHARTFFANEVAPFVDQWEKEKMVPRDIWRRMGSERLLCTTVPEQYQGPGHDFLYAVIVGEDEVEKGVVTLKDMVSGEQQEVEQGKLIKVLKDKMS